MGFDIQHYYSLHQSLTLEDLAKASSRHTLKGLVKVINKVRLRRQRQLWKKEPFVLFFKKDEMSSCCRLLSYDSIGFL